MADDPLFGFTPVSPKSAAANDPLLGFKPAQAAAPTQSWSEYLLDHLHSFSQGLDAATRVATDAPTFGVMDKAFGPKAQADTAADYQKMGGWSIPLSIAGSMVTGQGELAGAKAIGEAAAPYVGKWLGGALGSGAVGAGTSALGAYGHEAGWTPDAGDIGKQALIGGGLGAATGTLGGVVGRGGTLPPGRTATDLEAAKTAAYAPLDQIVFHGPSQIDPALDAVKRTMTGTEGELAKSTMAQVEKLRGQGLVTGSDIDGVQSRLGKVAGALSASPEDKEFAPKFSSALEDILQNTTPYGRNLTPGQGMNLMMPGQLGGTGFVAGDAAAARDAGDRLYGQMRDLQRTQDWVDASKVAGGPDVGASARSYLLSREGQAYAKPGSVPYDAFNTLADTAAKSNPISWYVKHYMIAPALMVGANELFQAETGEHATPLEHVGSDLGIGLGMMGASALYGKLSGARNLAAQQRALNAARVAVSTGMPQSPLQPNAPVRNALMQLIYGHGGSAGSAY